MTTKKIYSIIVAIFAVTYAYNLFWFLKSLIEFSNYGFQFSFFIRYIPTFAGITGLIIFASSQFKRSNLLRIMMCLEVMSFPFLLFWYYQFFTKTYGPFDQPPQLNWTFYVGVAINIALFLSSIIGLRMLSFNKTANLVYIEYGNERTAQFSPAPAGLRFANRLVDAVVIAYILLTNLASFQAFERMRDDIEPAVFLIFEIPFLLFYYIILEGIFNTSAGKCATGTIIVNASGERPNFGQILGRTFCRLIPFEPFSFFGAEARGWHDSIPNTYVVESINKEDMEMNEFTLDAETENV